MRHLLDCLPAGGVDLALPPGRLRRAVPVWVGRRSADVHRRVHEADPGPGEDPHQGRHAFAGSDEAGTARTLAKVVAKLGEFDLILMGEGSADDHTGQVPSRLAELLGLPQVTYVRELEVLEGGRLRGVRDLEEALEIVEVGLPAVVSVTGEINTPRLPALTAIITAARQLTPHS